jgi:flagellar hook-basal body complex protein FliE
MNVLAASALSKTLGAALPAATATIKTEPTKFANVLMEVAEKGLNTLRESEAVAMRGVAGTAPAEDAVSAIMNAERIFNTAMAVRDKAVSAYLEVSRMQL